MKENNFHIRENSWLAKLAAKKLNASSVAMVFGKTIHLHNISEADFFRDEKLLRHELRHIAQYKEQGFVLFLLKYLWETIRKGYYHNRFEVEARQAELEE